MDKTLFFLLDHMYNKHSKIYATGDGGGGGGGSDAGDGGGGAGGGGGGAGGGGSSSSSSAATTNNMWRQVTHADTMRHDQTRTGGALEGTKSSQQHRTIVAVQPCVEPVL